MCVCSSAHPPQPGSAFPPHKLFQDLRVPIGPQKGSFSKLALQCRVHAGTSPSGGVSAHTGSGDVIAAVTNTGSNNGRSNKRVPWGPLR